LDREGAFIKNIQYCKNRQKSPNLTGLPQKKGHPFFFLNNLYKSFSKIILLWYNIAHFCTNIRPTAPKDHGYPPGPPGTQNFFFNFLLFFTKNYINCENSTKISKIDIFVDLFSFLDSSFNAQKSLFFDRMVDTLRSVRFLIFASDLVLGSSFVKNKNIAVNGTD
jgi:hypothetical protein